MVFIDQLPQNLRIKKNAAHQQIILHLEFKILQTVVLIVLFFVLQVDDQMKLLQHSWSDMLVLDHMHQRMHNNLPDETTLPNGQKFDLLCLGLLGVPSLADAFGELAAKLAELKFDVSDYVCLKFLMLLNPGKSGTKVVQIPAESKLIKKSNF
jgi:hypothetical protein